MTSGEPRTNRLVAAVRSRRRLRRLVYRLGRARARLIIDWMRPCLPPGATILDVGSGTGNVTELLRAAGWPVTPLDVEDLTFASGIRPQLYDGQRMPFEDAAFDVALLVTVLHHVADPIPVLREAARVARRVIVIEDIYDGAARRYATYAIDSLLTLEFTGHPHSNRTDAGWRATFAELGLRLRAARYRGSMLVLRHALYCVDRLADGEEVRPAAG